MDFTELDQNITLTREAIDQLIESEDYGAVELAVSDLNYYISLLNN